MLLSRGFVKKRKNFVPPDNAGKPPGDFKGAQAPLGEGVAESDHLPRPVLRGMQVVRWSEGETSPS